MRSLTFLCLLGLGSLLICEAGRNKNRNSYGSRRWSGDRYGDYNSYGRYGDSRNYGYGRYDDYGSQRYGDSRNYGDWNSQRDSRDYGDWNRQGSQGWGDYQDFHGYDYPSRYNQYYSKSRNDWNDDELPWVNIVPGLESTHKFFHVMATYDEASERCEELGGYLAEMTDEYENRDVVQYMQDNSESPRDRIWIGANDMSVEGNMEWRQSKMPLRFAYWDFSGSENNDERDCAYVDMATGMWKMMKCNSRPSNGFMCERDY